ncbi:MAG: nitronate monooxygenase [Acetatifactor sp.]|nr:nitronate monooxygenase [Acetatifactor sp.]
MKSEGSGKLKELKIGDLTAAIPVIQGGMGVGISLHRLAGAVAAEGGIGIISTAQIGFREEGFHEDPIGTNLKAIATEIQKARELAPGGIIGVNIMVATRGYDDYVRAAVQAGADLIISGAGLPMNLPALTEGSRTKIAPIVSSRKAAEVIFKYWVKKYDRLPDLVVIEGPKAGGHLGFSTDELEQYLSGKLDYDEEIRSIVDFVKERAGERQMEIPVVAAGGVYTREDAEHMVALGADGVQMATRFVTTYECDAPDAYKQAYIRAQEQDITLVKSPVGMPGRAIRNAFLERTKEGRIPHGKCHLCVSTCKPAETPYCITEALVNAAEGRVEDALLFAGSNAYRAKGMEHVCDIMREFA